MSPDKKMSPKFLKVDNWGSYILQRLQLMFAKGDSCDLTLRFQNNQELKVHKLMLSTCSKYFEGDDSSIFKMPESLTYSCMLPIINFMYSGCLEIKPELQENMLLAAKLLEMPVLIHLLKAQSSNDFIKINKSVLKPTSSDSSAKPINMLAEKKLPVLWKKPSYPYYGISNKTTLSDENPAPTRLEWPSEDTSSLIINSPSFSSISYESEPVMMSKNAKSEEETEIRPRKRRVVPPLRSKRTMAKQIGESQIIMGSLSDEDDDSHFETLHSYDDSEDECVETIQKTPKPILKSPALSETPTTTHSITPAKRVRFCFEDKENAPDKQTQSLTVEPDTTKTDCSIQIPCSKSDNIEIPISDQSKHEVNHAKIIAEVLKKFPDLVKNNKNIKLKITSPSGSTNRMSSFDKNKPVKSSYVVVKPANKLPEKSVSELIDVNMTPENSAGPLSCKKCSVDGEPLKFDSYFTFRKHLQNHSVVSKVCELCGYKSTKKNLYFFHLFTKHNIVPPKEMQFPKCDICQYVALNESLLNKHLSCHQNFKELVCNICKLSFKTTNSFQTHCVTCKPAIEVKNFSCKNCNKSFRTNGGLKNHYKDCIASCIENVNSVPINSSIEPVEMIEMPIIETVPGDKGDHSLVQLPPGIIVTDNTNVTLLQEDTTNLTNVSDRMPTSIGFTVLPEDHQTVILLDDNSDFFLQGNSSVVVTSETNDEYIVPEIIPENVTRLYTSGNISYAMNATSVITYPVVHVPGALPDHSNGDPLASIPVSEASDIFITDKEITIAAEVASISDVTQPSSTNSTEVKLENIDLNVAATQNLTFVNSDNHKLLSEHGDLGHESHNLKEELLDKVEVSNNQSTLITAQLISGQKSSKAKDISNEWDFDNEDDDQEENGEDPEKKPSRPSIELQFQEMD